jgi:hypothetical protein
MTPPREVDHRGDHVASSSARHPTRRTVLLLRGIAIVTLAAAALAWIGVLSNRTSLGDLPGVDFRLYRDAAAGWLAGGPFYPASQLAAPFSVTEGTPILFPPPVLILLLPFTVLPAALWWVVPLTITAWVLWRLRPSAIAWAIIGIALWFPNTIALIVAGNPAIWSLAALALGALYGWPSVLAAIKLTIAPLALFGCWKRSWWATLAIVAVVSALFAPMWPDYLIVLANTRAPLGVLYSVGNVPMLLIPIVAWLARDPSATALETPGRTFGRVLARTADS